MIKYQETIKFLKDFNFFFVLNIVSIKKNFFVLSSNAKNFFIFFKFLTNIYKAFYMHLYSQKTQKSVFNTLLFQKLEIVASRKKQ